MDAREHDLLERLSEPHCAICHASAHAARAYLSGVMRDGINDARTRDEWRRRHGLCREHWRVWRGLETPALSSSILVRDLLGARLAAHGRPVDVDCRACGVASVAEGRVAAALERIPPPHLERALEAGRGFVCLRHLEAVGARHRPIVIARLERLVADLDDFVRKSDYRHAHEPLGAAGDAWLRAIRALGGDV